MTKQKQIMKKFRITEISGVDRPAQAGARALIMKCDSSAPGDPRLLSDEMGHSHMLDLALGAGSTSYDKMEGEEYGHTHPWVVTMNGDIVIGAAMGHTHSVLAKRDTTNGGNEVEKTVEKSETEKALETKFAKAEADLARANAILALNDSERAFFKSLGANDQDEFLKATPEARKTRIEKAAGDNPVVYTDSEGTEFRKNDDPRLVGIAKRADADRKARLESEARLSRQGFEKRANDEMSKLPGSVDVKVELLKAIDGIKDEAARTGALALIKAGNEAIAKAFDSKGTSQAPNAPAGDTSAAQGQLDTFAKAYAKEKNVDYYTAYAAVSEQHPELLKTAVG